jgi:L-histidine Nalpha-methyltransferase
MYTQIIPTGSVADFAADVRTGLSKPGQKELPSKYLYDEVGSALFEVISVLPEYGLTRADERLLRLHAQAIVDRMSLPVLVTELGSGSGKKTRWLLEALSSRQNTAYYPIEISRSALARCCRELGEISALSIVGVERPYLDGLLEVVARRRHGEHVLVLFLGSTIGNFDRTPGERFLAQVRQTLIPGDAILLGTDLEKPVHQLVLAYDDPLGVTAAFNLNLLCRINRELGANFIPSRFRHVAHYSTADRRIEMHLRSLEDQIVNIPVAGLEVKIASAETIWTESCHKYRVEEVALMAEGSGFHCESQWVDSEWPFAESLFIAK